MEKGREERERREGGVANRAIRTRFDIIRFTSRFDPVSFQPNLNIIINYVA